MAGFRPAFGLGGAHRQTLAAALLPAPRPPLARERFELPDGDFVDLDWHRDARGPAVLVLHGLEGDSRSAYARRLLAALARCGRRAGALGFVGEHPQISRQFC
ncbi:MAG TPA: alpha/beta hydrolase, partial [Plasticicumulans sp.]|nr:alpha/beta hydrolase [Plasticicumulans sp.]